MGYWCCSIIVTHYTTRGGDSSSSSYSGIFSVFAYYDDSYARWYLGAALSFSNYMKTIK